MYENLGLNWAASIPAFLSVLCVPMPFVFWKYGPAIRARCKYAAEAAEFMKKMAGQSEEDDTAEDDSGTQSEDAVEKAKEGEEEREEEIHEAIDYSYEAADEQPRLEPIKSRSARRPSALRRITSYDDSPFDLDRMNTQTSFGWERNANRSRSTSVSSKAGRR